MINYNVAEAMSQGLKITKLLTVITLTKNDLKNKLTQY